MEFFKVNTQIDFMGKRDLMAAVLIVLIAISLGSLLIQGLTLGLDFSGGTLIEASYDVPIDLKKVRGILGKGGFPDAVVQDYGSSRDILVRIAPRAGKDSAELGSLVLESLQRASIGKVEMRKVEYVGAQVGNELIEQGGLAMVFALLGIFIYVVLRFEWRLSLGAVLATVHDTIFTLGFFSLFRIEFDLTVLAAVLTVIGYSLNDTIVVFDRIRENFRRMRKGTVVDVMNAAINQTLSRTIMTSGTTMMVVLSLFFFGGPVIHGFALALIVGILIGTVSSIYVASPLALWLGVTRADMAPVKRQDTGRDDPL